MALAPTKAIPHPSAEASIAAERQARVAIPHNEVCVCSGPRCAGSGGGALLEELKGAIEMTGLFGRAAVHGVGCLGLCGRGPSVVIQPEGILYASLRREDAAAIIGEHLFNGRIAESLCLRDPGTGRPIRRLEEAPAFRRRALPIPARDGNLSLSGIEAHAARGGCFIWPSSPVDA